MDLLKLPYPTTEHFQQSYGSSLERQLYITRGFLKPRYEDTDDSVIMKKKQYVDELVEEIENYDIPFRQLVLSNETLTEVAISLHRDYTEKEAEECLEEVRTRDMFKVVQTSSDRFDRAASHFIDICGKDPNFGEFIDYQLMADENIQYVSTWDSDFMSFEDISLLPVSRWER